MNLCQFAWKETIHHNLGPSCSLQTTLPFYSLASTPFYFCRIFTSIEIFLVNPAKAIEIHRFQRPQCQQSLQEKLAIFTIHFSWDIELQLQLLIHKLNWKSSSTSIHLRIIVFITPFFFRIGKHPCNCTSIQFYFAWQLMQFVGEFVIILGYSNWNYHLADLLIIFFKISHLNLDLKQSFLIDNQYFNLSFDINLSEEFQ